MQLISYALCPYAQRVSIVLDEKGCAFERINIDLSDKPDWFMELSPHGKVPILRDGPAVLFESVAILEYLEDTVKPSLHPQDALNRAKNRAWIAFGGTVLDAIGRLYSAREPEAFADACAALRGLFEKLELAAVVDNWAGATDFTVLDAVYAPVFRYFDLFDDLLEHGVLVGFEALACWRERLAGRTSVRSAVEPTYKEDLRAFLGRRQSFLLSAT